MYDRAMRRWLLAAVLFAGCQRGRTPSPTPPSSRAPDVEVTILSTMVTDRGIGEWGFAALVEVDGARVLFDTGFRPQTVLRNADTLDIDLSTVDHVVLSHHHDDHVGGLLPLRAAFPDALGTVHVGRGMFEPRHVHGKGRQVNDMLEIRTAFEGTGGRFVVHDAPAEIAPGVWVTGPVPRRHPERNWSGSSRIRDGDGWVEDSIAESQSLVVVTDRGLVVVSGCGHAGIVNTVEYAASAIHRAPIHAAIGGFHLLHAER